MTRSAIPGNPAPQTDQVVQIAQHEVAVGGMAQMFHRGRVAVVIAPCGDTEGFGQRPIERRGFDEQPNDLLEQERIAVVVGRAVERAEILPVDPKEGHPIARPVAVGYGATIRVSVAALAWLWTLASIPLGSLCFYGGLAGLILVGRFDSGLSARLGR